LRPLVLVHGFMGGSDQWALQAPLGERRRLICPDLPGFGRNARAVPLKTIGDFADWVIAELSHLGIDRFDLIGHSMGGMVVQEMVRRIPDRVARLILYGTGPTGMLPGRFETIETSIQRARTDGPKSTARRIAATWFLAGETAREFPACAAIAEASTLPAIIAGLEAMQGWSGRDHLPHIKAPTLVLWGDGDRTYPWSQVEELWQTIADSRLAVIPDCAHAVHLERPEIFNLQIDSFLSGG